MQDFVGQQIDRYHITERQGMGGMAVVYKAYDTRLDRDVAIKLIRAEAIPGDQYERLLRRFEREAKAQARFNHRHIVPVYDYGEVEGSPYLVMAYIPGGTLKAYTGQPVPYQQAIRWLIPVADALGYAHNRGIIHRDVKPSNILFGEEQRILLSDFGIAKVMFSPDQSLTGTGLGVGTPEYMAPEQWLGRANEATDQYALGVVLYELVTGKKPYTADTPAAIAIQQATEPLRRPRELVHSIPERVEKVIFKVLSKDPHHRYADMGELQKALEKFVYDEEELVPVIHASEFTRTQKEEAKEIFPEKQKSSRLSKSLNLNRILTARKFWMLPTALIIFLGTFFVVRLINSDSAGIVSQAATQTAEALLILNEQNQTKDSASLIENLPFTQTPTTDDFVARTTNRTETQELTSAQTITPTISPTISPTITFALTHTNTAGAIFIPPTATFQPAPSSTNPPAPNTQPPPPPTNTQPPPPPNTQPPPPTSTQPPPPTNTPVPTNTSEARPPTPTPP
ncbi:MAG: serine/threonine protein kinase [Anaerolineaceae bacterium]|nr:serine/threonine protein kinase [Anaerolineaceae bacterium]